MFLEREKIQEVADVLHFLESRKKVPHKIYVGQYFYTSLTANNFFVPDTNPKRTTEPQGLGKLLGLDLEIAHELGDSFYVECKE